MVLFVQVKKKGRKTLFETNIEIDNDESILETKKMK